MGNEKAGRKLLYVGDDRSYWNELKIRFKNTYKHIEFEYLHLAPAENEHFQTIYVKVFDLRPSIIYIDISKDTRKQLKLCRLIKREFLFKDTPMVTLVDKFELLRDAKVSGADFIHIKCGEYHDVVYDPYYMCYPKEASKPEFAVARMERDAQLIEDFRIGYITPTSIHAEGDVRLEKGQLVQLDSVIPTKVIPSRKFVVTEVSQSDLYFDHKYSYDLDFLFVDKPELDANALDPVAEKAKFEEKMAIYQDQLRRAKKGNRDWVLDNMDNSAPKKTKILIVDKAMTTLRSHEHFIDKFPYLIRCQALLSDDLHELHSYRPSLFVFQYPDIELSAKDLLLDEDEKQKKIAELKELIEEYTHRLELLVETIKKIEGHTPFILIYNCKTINSKGFQERFKYPLILANASKLSLDNIVQLAEIYENKQQNKLKAAITQKVKDLKKQDPVKYKTLKESDFEDKRFYIKKNHDLSFVSIRHSITILSLSETEIKFSTNADLELGSYRMEFPVKMGVGLVPQEGKKCVSQGGQFYYHGMIHSVGEREKKALRQFINEVFTATVSEAEQKELDAFKKLNEQIQKQKDQSDAEQQQVEAKERIQNKIDRIKGLERDTSKSEESSASDSDAEKDSFGFVKK